MPKRANTFADVDRWLPGLVSTNGKREEATAQLCTMFEPLIVKLTAQYGRAMRMLQPSAMDFDDLQQAARVGLVEACRTYDPARGAFNVHAVWCVRHALQSHIEHSAFETMRLSTRNIRRLMRIRAAGVQIAQRLKREPTCAEIGEDVGLPTEVVEQLLRYDLTNHSRTAETVQVHGSAEAEVIAREEVEAKLRREE